MLDKFGMIVREIRIHEGILLYDMAKEFGIQSAELSGIECGRKPIPDWFIPKLLSTYKSAPQYEHVLIEAAKQRKEGRGM